MARALLVAGARGAAARLELDAPRERARRRAGDAGHPARDRRRASFGRAGGGSRPASSRCSLTGAIAFGVGHVWALPGRMLSRFGSGFLEFYDYQVPFDPARTRACTACCWSRCSPSPSPSRWRWPPAGPASPRSRWSSASAGRGRCCPGHDVLRGTLLLVAVLATAVVLQARPGARRRRRAGRGHARPAWRRSPRRARPRSPSTPSSTGSTGTRTRAPRSRSTSPTSGTRATAGSPSTASRRPSCASRPGRTRTTGASRC